MIYPELSIACTLSDNECCIAVLKNNKQLLVSEKKIVDNLSGQTMAHILVDMVEHLNLIGHSCQLILLCAQYQVIVMEAPNVPEHEMIKALRWSLKGLSDYDLEHVAIDTFPMPSITATEQKNLFIALTPLTLVNEKRLLLESAYLDVIGISIADIALKNLLTLMHHQKVVDEKSAPIIVISSCSNTCKLHIQYQDLIYLIRELPFSQTQEEIFELESVLYEIEQSMDYCVNSLNLPEPRLLLFTPSFHTMIHLFQAIEEKINIKIMLIDLNHYLEINLPLSFEEQDDLFYSIIGAIR